jgi:uncharacterized damage-inducible protein DinB
MSDDQLELLRYPVGRFQPRPDPSTGEWLLLLDELERLPAQVRAAVSGLPSEQLERTYRPGGWTVRQVVHHLPDSHMHAYIRCRRAVTEENPAVSPYDEAAWAGLADAMHHDVEPSLAILDGLHQRWTAFLRGLAEQQLQRAYLHSEMGPVTVVRAVQLYAWHGRHHLGHIMNALTSLRVGGYVLAATR